MQVGSMVSAVRWCAPDNRRLEPPARLLKICENIFHSEIAGLRIRINHPGNDPDTPCSHPSKWTDISYGHTIAVGWKKDSREAGCKPSTNTQNVSRENTNWRIATIEVHKKRKWVVRLPCPVP